MTLHLRPLEKLSIAGIFLVGFVYVCIDKLYV